MLERIAGLEGCKFVSAPDVVGDHINTARLFEEWRPELLEIGQPIALVAQDGLTNPPWDQFDALFIGGTTDFKLGADAHRLAVEAKERGKWVHMGRVNTRRRAITAKSWGVDSIDGTRMSMFTDDYLGTMLETASLPQQLSLDPT